MIISIDQEHLITIMLGHLSAVTFLVTIMSTMIVLVRHGGDYGG